MPTTVNTSTNTVTISEEKSSVLVTNNNTGTSVDVTGLDSPTITVATAGPKGDKGEPGSVSDYSGTLSGDHINLSGNMTASGVHTTGNISASGDIRGESLTTDQYIYHAGDPNTYLNFTDDRLRFNIGGISYLDLNDNTGPPREIKFNNGGNNVDLTIKGSSDSELFFTDASTNRVGIGTSSPSFKLDVDGDIRVTGGLIVDSNYNNSSIHATNILLTNSVKYTDSGGEARFAMQFDNDVVVLSNRTSNGKVEIRANTDTDGSGGEVTVAEFQDDSIQFNTAITASGNISASGDVYAESIILPFGQAINWGSHDGNHIRVDSGTGNIIFDSLKVEMQNGLSVSGLNGHITASGNLKVDGSQVDFTNLPTSDPSVAGRLWNSASYVKISAG